MSHYLAGNFGLAIIALTIIVNLLMLGLTLRQLRSTKAMQEMQPRLAELQKKYGKDRQKMAQEQMRLYKESGVKPAGCAITMVIQMPVWIALYQSIMLTLAVAPEGLLNLSKYLYSWPVVYSVLPLSRDFLWVNLAEPDLFLAILVGATMWLQQKMSMTMPTDPKQRSQSQMMLWMMPLMFGFIAMSVPSGLALYWLVSNGISIVMQYFIVGGWGGLARPTAGKTVVRGGGGDLKRRITEAETTPGITALEADIVVPSSTPEPQLVNGESEGSPQIRREGYQPSPRAVRHQSKRSKGHHPKRR